MYWIQSFTKFQIFPENLNPVWISGYLIASLIPSILFILFQCLTFCFSETVNVDSVLVIEVWNKGFLWDKLLGVHLLPLTSVRVSKEVQLFNYFFHTVSSPTTDIQIGAVDIYYFISHI